MVNSLAGQLHAMVSERRHSHAHHPVEVAATSAVEHNRVQDGPETVSLRFPMAADRGPVPRSASRRPGRSTPRSLPPLPGRHPVGAGEWRAVESPCCTRDGARTIRQPPCTCWRRLREWVDDGRFLMAWRRLLGKLDRLKQINWDEAIGDGSFSRAKVEPVGERAERRALRSATAARARAPRSC